jgi:hypothetical protein
MAALTRKQSTKATNQIALISETVVRRRPEARAGARVMQQAACRAELGQRRNPVRIMLASVRWRVTGDKWQVTRQR